MAGGATARATDSKCRLSLLHPGLFAGLLAGKGHQREVSECLHHPHRARPADVCAFVLKLDAFAVQELGGEQDGLGLAPVGLLHRRATLASVATDGRVSARLLALDVQEHAAGEIIRG